jgi:hypothetical protein
MATNNDAGMFKIGDIVIGSSDPSKSVYSSTGAKVIQDGVSIYGNTGDLQEKQKELVTSITRNGGKIMQTSQIKKVKKKTGGKNTAGNQVFSTSNSFSSFSQLAEETIEETPLPVQVKLQTIQFENDFGKMKAKVEHVVEHDQAFMLVFSDDDSVVFEPKVGETLKLHIRSQHETFDVYYPGVTFNSPESTKKLMILFKVPAENQE